MTVEIIEVVPTSPTSSEATLLLDDGKHQCRAFEHPRGSRIGALMKEPLLGFESRDVERDDSGPAGFTSDGTQLGCIVRGYVERVADPAIRVGSFVVELGLPLPGDIGIGDMVRFRCSRLDFMG